MKKLFVILVVMMFFAAYAAKRSSDSQPETPPADVKSVTTAQNDSMFAGLFQDWSVARTNKEYLKYIVDINFNALIKENPKTDPVKLRKFLEVQSCVADTEEPGCEVPTGEQGEFFDEAWRIMFSCKSPEDDEEAGRLLRKLMERMVRGSFSREVVAQYCFCRTPGRSPDFVPRRESLIRADLDLLKTGKWNDDDIIQCIYNRLSNVCADDRWPALEADLMPDSASVDPWMWEMTQGRASIVRAWQHRGSDYADKVTDAGWDGFNRELAKARRHFNRALELHPDWPQPYIRLIVVEMGLGSAKGMVDAFAQVVRRVPENGSAFSKLMHGLLPRWRGSYGMMMEFAVAAMDCPRRDSLVPAMGYGSLGYVAWDLPDPRWKMIYCDPQIEKRADEIFSEVGARLKGTPSYKYFLRLRFLHEAATLQYENAASTLAEYGGAAKFRAEAGVPVRGDLSGMPVTPWYDDVARQVEIFTGKHGGELCGIEKKFLAGDVENSRKELKKLIAETQLAPEDRDYLIDLYARWGMRQRNSEYCANGALLGAFAVACSSGNDDLAREMLEMGYDYAKYEKFPGQFVIMIARGGNDPLLIKKLKERGAPIDAADPNDKMRTALHRSATTPRPAITRALIALGAPLEKRDANNQTPLHLAVSAKQADAFKVLLDAGADINAQDKDGDTVLMFAPQVKADRQLYMLLLNAPGIDLNIVNKSGKTALHFMIEFNAPDYVIREMIKRGADVNMYAPPAAAPLDAAIRMNREPVVKMLRAAGAETASQLRTR